MTKQYLSFKVDGQVFGFPIEKVREINRIGAVTKVPNAGPYQSGVMNLRGAIISVVSLRLRMGLAEIESTSDTCTVVVDCGPQKIAVVVDGVQSVVNIDGKDIESYEMKQDSEGILEGIAKYENQIIMLIDIDQCFLGSLENVHEVIEEQAS